MKRAKEAEKKYRLEPDLAEHLEGFCIDKYEIDRMEWREGFFMEESHDRSRNQITSET